MARKAVGAVKSVFTPCSAIDAPERTGIGCADRLALVQDRRASVEQRRIDDVAVADGPADVATPPRTPRRARHRRCCVMLHVSATAWPPLSRTTPFGFPVVPDVYRM